MSVIFGWIISYAPTSLSWNSLLLPCKHEKTKIIFVNRSLFQWYTIRIEAFKVHLKRNQNHLFWNSYCTMSGRIKSMEILSNAHTQLESHVKFVCLMW